MKKHIFLHIGFPKTGTSSIQSFFCDNRQALKTFGVLYPKSGDTRYAGQAGIAFAARMKATKPFDILLSEIENSPCDKIVISSEYFFMLDPIKIKFLSEQFKKFKVTIIVYLRRQDSRIESGYLQVIRDAECRFSGDIVDYINFLKKHPRRTNYYKFLQPWSNSFDNSSVKVCVYEEHSGEQRLIPGFMEIIECPMDKKFTFNQTKKNVAYKPILNHILRRLNLLPLPKKAHILILSLFNFLTRHILGAGSIAQHNLLSNTQRKDIIEEYRDSNKKVATEYLHREDELF